MTSSKDTQIEAYYIGLAPLGKLDCPNNNNNNNKKLVLGPV
jgi:hypothetical protein